MAGSITLDETGQVDENVVTPALLEHLYEQVAWSTPHRTHASRQEQGSFHTPMAIVRYMVAETVAGYLADHGAQPALVDYLTADAHDEVAHAEQPLPDARSLQPLADLLGAVRVVDLSVGPGAFLVGMAGLLRQALRRLVRLQPSLRLPRSLGSLHGVDCNPLALTVCRERLRLASLICARDGMPSPALHLQRANSLVDALEAAEVDIAIGNPPYLRDSRKKDMPPWLPTHYRAATSHYDLYVLFMERSLQLLRPGGRMALLTSNRYLCQKYGRGIRRLLLENQLEAVVDLDFKTFDAGVRTCITMARRHSPPPDAAVVMQRIAGAASLPPVHRAPHQASGRVPLGTLAAEGDVPFRVDLTADDVARAERMRRDAVPLGEIALVTLGMVFHDPRPGGKRKSQYLSAQPTARHRHVVIDGEHVRRWSLTGHLWLDYRPDEHREPRFAELFAAPKILCRRIVGRGGLMAVLDEQARFFSDNVVGVVPFHLLAGCEARVLRARSSGEREALSRRFDVAFLAALLNSRLFSWYFQRMLSFGMHAYPDHFKQLPIREATPALQRRLAALARRLGQRYDAALASELDAAIDSLYAL